jgi:predicted metal-dependent phosphoesterase TrpH
MSNNTISSSVFKADLHCHSYFSGRAKHMRLIGARDCYSRPRDVYLTAKRRGMDLVTITDHDSIDGCKQLLDEMGDLPDFIIGEEVTTYVPSFGECIHIGVYGITEAQHADLQHVSGNAFALVAYLRQHRILFALNHFFHDFRHHRRLGEYLHTMAHLFGVVELQNGAMQAEHNEMVSEVLEFLAEQGKRFSCIGGSDAHTLRRIGTTYTASRARNKDEFLDDIRNARTFVAGRHATHLAIALDIYGVVLRYYPNVLTNGNEFGFRERLKNIAISLACSPFLFIPYVIAVKHTRRERQRLAHIRQLLSSLYPSKRADPAT